MKFNLDLQTLDLEYSSRDFIVEPDKPPTGSNVAHTLLTDMAWKGKTFQLPTVWTDNDLQGQDVSRLIRDLITNTMNTLLDVIEDDNLREKE